MPPLYDTARWDRTSALPKARFPLPELTGDRFPLPVNTGRFDGRAFPLAELTSRQLEIQYCKKYCILVSRFQRIRGAGRDAGGLAHVKERERERWVLMWRESENTSLHVTYVSPVVSVVTSRVYPSSNTQASNQLQLRARCDVTSYVVNGWSSTI